MLVPSKDFDIVCIIESRLSSKVSGCELCPHAFDLYRHDRDMCGGGVLIAVSQKLPSRLILASHLVEMLVVAVSLSPKVLLAVFTYHQSIYSLLLD